MQYTSDKLRSFKLKKHSSDLPILYIKLVSVIFTIVFSWVSISSSVFIFEINKVVFSFSSFNKKNSFIFEYNWVDFLSMALNINKIYNHIFI